MAIFSVLCFVLHKWFVSYVVTFTLSCAALPYLIPYHTIPYHTIPYHTMYHTIPCTIPYHVPYHTMYHTIPCTIPYHVPYHVPYHTMYHTIPYYFFIVLTFCTILSHHVILTMPYRTIPYHTIEYHIIPCETH